MKSWLRWLLIVLVAAAAAGGGYWMGHRGTTANAAAESDDDASKKDIALMAPVSVAPIRRASISESVVAYGTVVAPPNEVRVVAVPFEARVTKMLVTPGQVVSASQPLLEVEGSAATALVLSEATNAAAAAKRDLDLVQQRFNQKLATNTDLYTAQNAMTTALGRLQSLQQGGAGGSRQLTTEAAGVVSKVDVQIGQVVPIGGPLVEVAAANRIQVRLGVEPEDVPFFKIGQPVPLTRVDDPAAAVITGSVRLIAQRVDPATRLVEMTVALPPDAKLMLESFVSGTLVKSEAEGLVLPRDAVLPADDGGSVVFTVKDGHAVRHSVKTGIGNDREVQVLGDTLKEGEPAVVLGNYELEDGMQVEVHSSSAPTIPPAAQAPSATTAPSESGGAE